MSYQPNYYAIIPANVRYSKALEPNAKLLYGEITALTHKEGYCWASNDFFASLYDVDERTIKRWLQSLREQGFIKVELKKTGLKTERKIWIQDLFAKGQKCLDEDDTVENAPTDEFQRRDKNGPVEETKMPPNQYTVNIQEKQQQQDVAAVSLIDACLEPLQIPVSDKQWISDHYTYAIIQNAVKWATHPMTKINTTLQQAIKWACANQPQIPINPEDEAQQNKAFSQQLEAHYLQKGIEGFSALNSYAEVYQRGGMSNNTVIKYTEKGFKEQVLNALKKHGVLK